MQTQRQSGSSASCSSTRVAANVIYNVDLQLVANFIAIGLFGLAPSDVERSPCPGRTVTVESGLCDVQQDVWNATDT